MQRLFVYGTLAPGRENHHILDKVSGTWESASIKGFLLDKGWGASMGYPGIMPSDEGDEVKGWVLSSGELARYWTAIDEFEGREYRRVPVMVKLKEQSVEAFVYAIRI
ncbi:hypothetical protein GV64_21485 [Endozoicomonas elysicola]|uniref:Putative gamma-glutamylcyclotransferase n=1 Tax=Endozoicomonas elysicola TaxID=305900 RepID=A0A081KFM3_9GAMM|nr:hypothetical protein GV64_21485 [Endozoicomonas elysicola]